MKKERLILCYPKFPNKQIDASRYLCRYQKINDRLKESLKKSTLWFSLPKNFNDPYDCNLEEEYDITFDELYKYLTIKNNENMLLNQIEVFERTTELMKNPIEIRQLSENINQELKSKMGICCFSEEDNILLQWAHYADSHRGICLKFDITKDSDLFQKDTYKVNYQDNPIKFNSIREELKNSNSSSFEYNFATKSSDWSYEKEIRIIKEKEGEVKFQKESLVEIIFGNKCNDFEMEEIKRILNDYSYKVDLYKVDLKSDFNLDFIKLVL